MTVATTPVPLAVPQASKFQVNRPPRPLLARDADSLYWMSRYVERAEHVARLLLVHSNLLVDVGDLAPKFPQWQWQSVLRVMHMPDLPEPAEPSAPPLSQRIAQHMTFDPNNANSIISSLTRARENARAVREIISAEMWESLNTLYWAVRGDDAPTRFEDSPDDFYRSVMNGSMLFQGLTDQTLAHDQRWLFTQLGKYFERIDVTCRVLESKFGLLRSAETILETALRNIHWMAVLRSCCSLEAYRRRHLADIDPMRIATFVILEQSFPRSIRYCVRMAHEAAREIRSGITPHAPSPAERVLGRLDARLEYAEPGEIAAAGLAPYLQAVQSDVADAALALQKSYFLH